MDHTQRGTAPGAAHHNIWFLFGRARAGCVLMKHHFLTATARFPWDGILPRRWPLCPLSRSGAISALVRSLAGSFSRTSSLALAVRICLITGECVAVRQHHGFVSRLGVGTRLLPLFPGSHRARSLSSCQDDVINPFSPVLLISYFCKTPVFAVMGMKSLQNIPLTQRERESTLQWVCAFYNAS